MYCSVQTCLDWLEMAVAQSEYRALNQEDLKSPKECIVLHIVTVHSVNWATKERYLYSRSMVFAAWMALTSGLGLSLQKRRDICVN